MLHVLPLGRLRQVLDVRPHFAALEAAYEEQGLRTSELNFEGLLLHTGDPAPRRHYVQWFRSGALEIVTSNFHSELSERLYLDGGCQQVVW